MWDVGMTQAGSGVASLSSPRIGFNHSGLGLIFGRYAESVSYESKILAVSGIGMSSIGCSEWGPDCYLDEPEGASIVLVNFQVDDCGAGGYDEPEVPESCLLFLLRS
ncbi:hypothetical protein Tco_1103254 [Tanacetum coccineum]